MHLIINDDDPIDIENDVWKQFMELCEKKNISIEEGITKLLESFMDNNNTK